MAPPPPAPPLSPPELPEEMQEQILLRFPSKDPARLVQAALVCKPWCRLISGPGFRRRYLEFHRTRTRTPPLLGVFCNTDEPYNLELGRSGADSFRFVPTSSFTAPRANSGKCWWWVTDARHGRVLLHRTSEDGVSPTAGCHGLMVWDPTTGEKKALPLPASALTHTNWWTATILCDAGAGGAFNHLDCHREPFTVVFVASRDFEGTFISTYSSNAASWSMPIVSTKHSTRVHELTHAAHLGNALYFLMMDGRFILKYDLELHEMSWIEGPISSSRCSYVALTTTEGGGLGLAILHKSRYRIYMWSWKDAPKGDAKWTRSRVIELWRFDDVLGFVADIGVIFVKEGRELYTIDLKTNKPIRKAKVAETRRRVCFVVPYFSFYTPCTPALEGATIGGEGRIARGGGPWRRNKAPAPLVPVNLVSGRDCNSARLSTCYTSAPPRLHEIRMKAPAVGLQVCLEWTSSSNLQQDLRTKRIPDM